MALCIPGKDLVFEEYGKGDALPFMADKDLDNPSIAYAEGLIVEYVQGKRDPFKGVKAVRKTITITGTQEISLQNAKDVAKREANILHRARHGHVVNIITAYFHDPSESKTQLSIVMDRAGSNLGVYLHRGNGKGEKGPPQEQWFSCLINVVAYIHGLGIRHRDIKPENVLIQGNRVLLADFGISKMGLGKTIPTSVQELAKPSTAAYCAPEVEEGSTRGRSADIFSLGAVFLEMLLSHPPPRWDEKYRKEADELQSRLRERTGPNNSSSYALNIETVHDWMGGVEARLQLDGWRSTILSFCRKMLDADRDQRPLADDLMRADRLLRCQCADKACKAGRKDRVRQLLRRLRCQCADGAPPAESNNNLIKACKEGQVDEVRQLLGRGADPNTKGAIHQATVAGNKEIVTTFLRHEKFSDVNIPDYGGQTVLHCAAGYRRVEVVELLLGWNPEVEVNAVDEEGRTALFFAAGWGDAEVGTMVVGQLLDKGANVTAEDKEKQTALHLAANRGHAMVVDLLLKQVPKVDVNAKDKKGVTALHLAAGRGRTEVVGLLLEAGADAMAEDNYRQTVLHLAAGYGSENVVRQLLNKVANMTANNEEERTVLDFAAWSTSEDVVRLLYKKTYGTREREDKEAQTALHFAAKRGRTEVVGLLLKAGADASTVDDKGRTAHKLAEREGHMEVVKLLDKDSKGRTAAAL